MTLIDMSWQNFCPTWLDKTIVQHHQTRHSPDMCWQDIRRYDRIHVHLKEQFPYMTWNDIRRPDLTKHSSDMPKIRLPNMAGHLPDMTWEEIPSTQNTFEWCDLTWYLPDMPDRTFEPYDRTDVSQNCKTWTNMTYALLKMKRHFAGRTWHDIRLTWPEQWSGHLLPDLTWHPLAQLNPSESSIDCDLKDF